MTPCFFGGKAKVFTVAHAAKEPLSLKTPDPPPLSSTSFLLVRSSPPTNLLTLSQTRQDTVLLGTWNQLSHWPTMVLPQILSEVNQDFTQFYPSW